MVKRGLPAVQFCGKRIFFFDLVLCAGRYAGVGGSPGLRRCHGPIHAFSPPGEATWLVALAPRASGAMLATNSGKNKSRRRRRLPHATAHTMRLWPCWLLLAALVRGRDASCRSRLDCALSPCVHGKCVCKPGWKNPESLTGTPCSAFDLLPADPANPGYRNASWPSWGGHPVFWPAASGGDGRWHLFTPQFANECR